MIYKRLLRIVYLPTQSCKMAWLSDEDFIASNALSFTEKQNLYLNICDSHIALRRLIDIPMEYYDSLNEMGSIIVRLLGYRCPRTQEKIAEMRRMKRYFRQIKIYDAIQELKKKRTSIYVEDVRDRFRKILSNHKYLSLEISPH